MTDEHTVDLPPLWDREATYAYPGHIPTEPPPTLPLLEEEPETTVRLGSRAGACAALLPMVYKGQIRPGVGWEHDWTQGTLLPTTAPGEGSARLCLQTTPAMRLMWHRIHATCQAELDGITTEPPHTMAPLFNEEGEMLVRVLDHRTRFVNTRGHPVAPPRSGCRVKAVVHLPGLAITAGSLTAHMQLDLMTCVCGEEEDAVLFP